MTNIAAPHQTFPALSAISELRHAFTLRVPGLDTKVERETALARLDLFHRETIANIGLGDKKLITAQQVHGNRVVRVSLDTSVPVAECDGLITNDKNVALGIYTADCGAIYLYDDEHQALGLLHSGKKGTELEILTIAIRAMAEEFGTRPEQLIIQLAPCIRPPHYEIDFAAEIRRQALVSGVIHYHDCGLCTASDLQKYYSYRRELGKTGRHLSVLGYAH